MTALGEVLAAAGIQRIARALAARPARALELEASWRRAAVAMVLRAPEPERLELLMIKRAAYVGDPWSGHVALPGGRQEPGDPSLVVTAIRETREETAVDLARDAQLLGQLDELHPRTVTLPRLTITPFVFAYAGAASLVLSDEVADAFWVPVDVLRDPATSREVVLELTGGRRSVPSFQHAGHTIWGLTERILRQFLAL